MSHSYIHSFKSTPNRSGIVKSTMLSFMATFAFFVLLDITLNFFAPVNLYGGWEHQQAYVKMQNLKNYSEKTQIDVLLYGNSVVMSLDPALIEQKWQKENIHGFNAGIGGIVPETALFILRNGIFPTVKPRLIIYFIGPRDLRDRNIPKRYSSPMTSHIGRRVFASTIIEKLEVYAENISYIFAARRSIRDYITRGQLPETTLITADKRGFWKQTTSNISNKLNGKGVFPANDSYRTRYNHYQIKDGGEYSELISMIELAESENIDFILVNMPISPACFSLFDRPQEDYQLYQSALKQVINKTGVKFYDMHADLELKNVDFSNADHLNMKGDEKVIEYINKSILHDYFVAHAIGYDSET